MSRVGSSYFLPFIDSNNNLCEVAIDFCRRLKPYFILTKRSIENAELW